MIKEVQQRLEIESQLMKHQKASRFKLATPECQQLRLSAHTDGAKVFGNERFCCNKHW